MPDDKKVTRKLRAILSADVKGYSLLMADDEAHTIETLKKYQQIMFDIITQHSGRVVDNPGDNWPSRTSSRKRTNDTLRTEDSSSVSVSTLVTSCRTVAVYTERVLTLLHVSKAWPMPVGFVSHVAPTIRSRVRSIWKLSISVKKRSRTSMNL